MKQRDIVNVKNDTARGGMYIILRKVFRQILG